MKNQFNDNNQKHGYWGYWYDLKLALDGFYINGVANGYWCWYSSNGDGSVTKKLYYI